MLSNQVTGNLARRLRSVFNLREWLLIEIAGGVPRVHVARPRPLLRGNFRPVVHIVWLKDYASRMPPRKEAGHDGR